MTAAIPRRWRRFAKRVILAMVAMVAMVAIGALFALALLWLTSTTGSAWLITTLGARLPGSLTIEEVSGSLRSGLHLQAIHYRNGSLVVEIDDLTTQLRPFALLRGWLEVDRLALRGVRLTLPASPASPASPDESPSRAAPQFDLPLGIRFRSGQIADLAWQREDGPRQRIESIEWAGQAQGHRLRLDALAVRAPAIDPAFEIEVAGSLGWTATAALDLTTTWSVQPRASSALHGRGQLSGSLEAIRVDLRLEAPARLAVTGKVNQVTSDPMVNLAIAVERLVPRALVPGTLQADWPDYTIRGQVAIEGHPRDVRLRAQLDTTTSAEDTPWHTTFDIDRTGATTWQVNAATLARAGMVASLTVAGPIDLEPAGPRFALAADWRDLTYQAGSVAIAAKRGHATITGSIDAFRVELASSVAVADDASGTINLVGHGDRTSFAIEHFESEIKQGRVEATGQVMWHPTLHPTLAVVIDTLHGRWGADEHWAAKIEAHGVVATTWDIAWSATLPDLSRFSPTAAGQLMGDGRVTGPRAQPSIQASLRGGDIVFGAHRAASIVGDVLLTLSEAGRADLDLTLDSVVSGTLACDRVTIQTRGTVAEHTIDATLVGANLEAALRVEGHGDLAARGWRGVVSNSDFDTPLLGAWHLDQPQHLDQPALTVPATVSYGGAGFAIENLCLIGTKGRACVPRAALETDGALRIEADLDLGSLGFVRGDLYLPATGIAAGIEAPVAGQVAMAWNDLSTLLPLLPERFDRLAGALTADLTLSGSRATPMLRGQAALRDGRLGLLDLGILVEDATLQIHGEDGEHLRVRGSATSGAGQVTVDGTLSTATRAVAFQLDGDQLEVLARPAGTLTVAPNLQITGTPEGLAVRGGVYLDTVRLVVQQPDGRGETVELSRPAHAQVELRLGRPLGPAIDAPLDGQIEVEVADLTFLPSLEPRLRDTRGRLAASIVLGGVLAAPRVTGDAHLRDGQVQLPELGLTLTGITLDAHELGAGGTTIAGVAHSGEGALRIDGTFDARARQGELTVRGSEVTIIDRLDTKVVASPDLTLTLRDHRVEVRGSVAIPSAKLDLDRGHASVRASSDVVVNGRDDSDERAITLDTEIDLTLGNDIAFTGLGLTLTPTGSLHLRAEPGRASSAVGELRVDGGTYQIYGQTLSIDSGRISYAGGPLTNPLLDIRATRKTRSEVIAGVRLSGPLAAPETEVFTEPSSPPSDALAFLVIGRPLAEADAGENDALANAATSVGLKRGNLLLQPLGRKLGLDSASFEDTSDFDEARLLLGKNLSQRLYVAYGIGLFRPVNTFLARYRLFKHLTLQAQSGAATEIDILFEHERGEAKARQPSSTKPPP